MTFRDELLVESLADADAAPRAGRARLILPQAIQVLWDAEVVLEFDPPDHILAWVNIEGDAQAFLARVVVSRLPAPQGPQREGGQVALGAVAVLWTLIHRDVDDHTTDYEPDPDAEREKLRSEARAAAQERVRTAYATMVDIVEKPRG